MHTSERYGNKPAGHSRKGRKDAVGIGVCASAAHVAHIIYTFVLGDIAKFFCYFGRKYRRKAYLWPFAELLAFVGVHAHIIAKPYVYRQRFIGTKSKAAGLRSHSADLFKLAEKKLHRNRQLSRRL